MSVRTDADKAIDSAVGHVDAAIRELSRIFVERVWGFDHFDKDARIALRGAMFDLIEIREALEAPN
jgi:hypothetical protein